VRHKPFEAQAAGRRIVRHEPFDAQAAQHFLFQFFPCRTSLPRGSAWKKLEKKMLCVLRVEWLVARYPAACGLRVEWLVAHFPNN